MISLSPNKFLFLFSNYPKLSSKILQYLHLEEALEFSLTCKILQTSVNELVKDNIQDFLKLPKKSFEEPLSSEEEVKSDIEITSNKTNKGKKNNNLGSLPTIKWNKKNIFVLDEIMRQDLTDYRHFQ